MKQKLQRLYDDCNWYGYATYKKQRIYAADVLRMAKENNIELTYNCPA